MPEPFNPRAFLELAEELGSDSDDEARLRTAISRAYYALFLIAREKTGVPDTAEGPHSAVRRALKQRGFRIIANKLEDLFMLRVVADYQLAPHDTSYEDWAANWSLAQQLAQDLLPKITGVRTGRLPRSP